MTSFYETPVKYRINDIRRLRKKYKPGMKLEIMRQQVDEGGRVRRVLMRCTVVRAYPHFVSCLDPYGQRISPDYVYLEEQAKIIR